MTTETAEEETPGLLTFLSDVHYIFCSLITVVQFIFGISYICGRNVVEWLSWLILGLWQCFCTAAEGLKALFDAIIELEESIIRGIILVRYGIDMLFEAFQVTVTDLIAFGERVCVSFGLMCHTLVTACSDGLSALIFTIPQHICTTLSLIGDTSIDVTTLLLLFIRNFFVQLVWSPINFILASCHLGLYVASLPARAFTEIPWSAHIGSVVLILVYMVYCKLSILRFARLCLTCCVYVIHITRALPNLIRQFFSSWKIQPTISTELDSDSATATKGLCVVCCENFVGFLAHPCMHLSLCEKCVHVLVEIDNRCPMCRKKVDHYARVYVS